MENVQQKLVTDTFLILVNNPKLPLHSRNFFKNKIFSDRIIKEPYLTVFFLSNPFNRQDYEKQKNLELMASSSSGYKTSSEKLV